MTSETGIISLAKLFFKLIVALFLALGAIRAFRTIFILMFVALLIVPWRYYGESVFEHRDKAVAIYGLISPRGGYPPCFAVDACAPDTVRWIKEATACLTNKPDCEPDTQQIIEAVKSCLADGSCKSDVYQLFQKEEDARRNAELIERYVKDGPPACYLANNCSPQIAELARNAEYKRRTNY